MARVLLLDLDKTLIDLESHVDYCAALDAVKARLETRPEVELPETGWGRCTVEAMQILVATAGTPLWTELSDLIEGFELRGVPNSRAMPHLAAFERAIAGVPRAIVTLLGNRGAEAVLAQHGWSGETVIGRAPELRPKPHPDQVERALAALGARPEDAAMIGDSTWDRGAAEAAGVRFVGLTNGRVPHEFGEGAEVVEDLAAAAEALLRP